MLNGLGKEQNKRKKEKDYDKKNFETSKSYKRPRSSQVMRWLVTRHQATKDWLLAKMGFDSIVDHLDINLIHDGDEVVGVLPINIAAEVCAKGARYFHVAIQVTKDQRGKELDDQELAQLDPKLIEYQVIRLGNDD